ncbi:MAG: hypothetical protein V7646_1984, partial [Pseudonocardia sp.]
ADKMLVELGWNLDFVPRTPDRAAGGILVLAVEPPPAWEPWLGVAA